MINTYAIIIAGGGGTRLWPISRKDRPKQLIPLIAEETLFQATVERLKGFIPDAQIFVVTASGQAPALKEQAPNIPAENFLIEPAPRGTASAIGLAAAILRQRDPQASMVVLPADHYIRNRDLFHHLLRIAVDVAAKDHLVTLGISPTFPSTAYGYIQQGDALRDKFNYPVYAVKRFKEKPDEPSARAMLSTGDHSWNSGIFIWKVETILAEMKKQMPALYSALEKISASNDRERDSVIEKVWHELDNQTIDYGVMENAERVAVLPASGLEWSDVGNWESLFDVLIPDEEGNILFGGQHIPIETHRSLVYGSGKERLIVTIGVDDLVIVDSGDVLLVCHKDQSQKVREIVAQLKKDNNEKYL